MFKTQTISVVKYDAFSFLWMKKEISRNYNVKLISIFLLSKTRMFLDIGLSEGRYKKEKLVNCRRQVSKKVNVHIH